jgi:ribonuclease HI
MYKVNWDAAVDKKNGHIGLGIVVRDYEGVVLAAWSTTKNFLANHFVAEALLAFHAVELCRERGFFDILLKGDALQIVNAVKTTRRNWSNFGHIVDGIKTELSQLRSWRIEHAKRNANTTAHTNSPRGYFMCHR